MLKPATDRLDYGKLITPPEGYSLECAVGTTYSLDLDTLIGVCLALGISIETDSDMLKDPLYLLNTLRKSGDKIAIFTQAGQIHLPSNLSPLYILLEKIVYQVQLRSNRRMASFHPKVWLIKYRHASGEELFRLIVLSRNLTGDRSWDVTVALDGHKQTKAIKKNQAFTDFLKFLRGYIPTNSDYERSKRSIVKQLLSDFQFVDFQTDMKEFSDYEFLPVGIPKSGGGTYSLSHTPLMGKNFQSLMIMSPFLSSSVINKFNQRADYHKNARSVLITRRDALSGLKPDQCDQFEIYTMKDEVVTGESLLSEDKSIQNQDIHAKLYLWQRYTESELYLGSLNATHSAQNGNIEAVLRLVSKNKYYNLTSLTKELFSGEPDNPDNPFEKTTLPSFSSGDDDFVNLLEKNIRQLLHYPIHAHVEPIESNYRVTVTFDPRTKPNNLKIRPLLLHHDQTVDEIVVFENLSLLHLSEFYVITASCGEESIERVIKIPTTNIPQNRENAVVTHIICDTSGFFQYLAFLLGDDYLLSALENYELKGNGSFPTNAHTNMPALYERMLKTAATSPEKFSEIDYLIKMVDGDGIIPDEFIKLYHSFRKAVGLK